MKKNDIELEWVRGVGDNKMGRKEDGKQVEERLRKWKGKGGGDRDDGLKSKGQGEGQIEGKGKKKDKKKEGKSSVTEKKIR